MKTFRVLLVASAEDLLATKLKVIMQRIETKDYQDVAALIKTGNSLFKVTKTGNLPFTAVLPECG